VTKEGNRLSAARALPVSGRPPAGAPTDTPSETNRHRNSDALPLSRLRTILANTNTPWTSDALRFAASHARSWRPRRATAGG